MDHWALGDRLWHTASLVTTTAPNFWCSYIFVFLLLRYGEACARIERSIYNLRTAPVDIQEKCEYPRLQQPAVEFCRAPSRTWKWIILKTLQIRTQAGWHLDFHLVGPTAKKVIIYQTFDPQCDDKFVLLSH